MSNNTVDAYKAAHAASDYLGSEEIDFFDSEDEDLLAPLEPIGGSVQSVVSTRNSVLSERWRWFGHYNSQWVTDVAVDKWLSFSTNDNSFGIVKVGYSDSFVVLAPLRGATTTSAVSDRIVSELGRIKDGWAGEGTVAPAAQTISDVEMAVERIPVSAKMPAIEIDEEDGTVALRWVAEDRSSSFSLVFRGNGRATGVIATIDPPRSSTWGFAVSEEIQIAKQFDEPMVRQLTVG
jgi:hypothetical protein